MPIYFFDIVDGGPARDVVGAECADDTAVRDAARRALPDIAREEIQRGGDRRLFTLIARNEAGQLIYTATLSYAGMWLKNRSLN